MKFRLLTLTLISQVILSGCAVTDQNQKTSNIKTQIGIEYIKEGNLDLAKVSLDEALELNPRSSVAHMTLGLTYHMVGTKASSELAEKHYKKAINLDPKNPQIRNNYGQYLFTAGKYQEAITQFDIASNMLGYSARDIAFNNLGQTHLKLGNTKEAILNFNRALKINKQYIDALTGMAEAYYQEKNYDIAQEILDEIIDQVDFEKFDAKRLWLTIRLAKIHNNLVALEKSTKALREKFPRSNEHVIYTEKKNTPSPW